MLGGAQRCKSACPFGFTVFYYVSGAFFLFFAIFIYLLRKTTVTFMVDGNDDKFELVITSRAEAMDLLRRYFNMKEEVRNDASVGPWHDPGVIPHPRQTMQDEVSGLPVVASASPSSARLGVGAPGGEAAGNDTMSNANGAESVTVAQPYAGIFAGIRESFSQASLHHEPPQQEAQGARAAAATLTV